MVKRRRLTRKRRVRLRAPPYGDVAMAAHGSAVAAWREGAVGRDRGEGLERGKEPARLAVRRAVPAELGDRSHGAVLGAKLRDFCDRTRFRYVFR